DDSDTLLFQPATNRSKLVLELHVARRARVSQRFVVPTEVVVAAVLEAVQLNVGSAENVCNGDAEDTGARLSCHQIRFDALDAFDLVRAELPARQVFRPFVGTPPCM